MFVQELVKTVTLLRMLIVTLVPQQISNAVGGSNVQPVPHSTTLGPAQMRIGGFVSVMVTISVQKAVLVQQSTACQVSVMISLQGTEPLVTALNRETMTLVPQQASVAKGGVRVQPPGVPACAHC